MIAPTVRDAKTLLKFAFSRGLLIGRDPIVIVAAVVIVVARLHGVKVSVDRAAQASRVQSVSVRKRLKELLGEIIAFAKKFPWGEDMSMKRLDDYLGIAFKFIATVESSKESSGFWQEGRTDTEVNPRRQSRIDLSEQGACVFHTSQQESHAITFTSPPPDQSGYRVAQESTTARFAALLRESLQQEDGGTGGGAEEGYRPMGPFLRR